MKSNTDAQVAAYWAKTKSSSNWWSNRAASRNYNFRVLAVSRSAGQQLGIHELIKLKVNTPLQSGDFCRLWDWGKRNCPRQGRCRGRTVVGYDLSLDRIGIAKQKGL